MLVVVDIDVMMVWWKIGVGELVEWIGIIFINFVVFKNGCVKVVCFIILDVLC